jgi:hypothetical protein
MEFIRQREPVFLSQIKGLSDDDIAGLPTRLPASYVEFLRCMGINSNGYSIFGSTYNHHLLTMLLGNNDAKALSKLADQLLAGLPGARRPHYQK